MLTKQALQFSRFLSNRAHCISTDQELNQLHRNPFDDSQFQKKPEKFDSKLFESQQKQRPKERKQQMSILKLAKSRTAVGMNRWDLFFDVVSYPVKVAALAACPTNTLLAEIHRNTIRIVDRSLQFMSTYWAYKAPDETRNYGYGKVTNLLSVIPAAAFMGTGLYWMFTPLVSTQVTVFSGAPFVSALIISLNGFLQWARVDRKVAMFKPDLDFKDRIKMFWDVIIQKQRTGALTQNDFNQAVFSLTGATISMTTLLMGAGFDYALFDRIGQAMQGALMMYTGGTHFRDQSRLLTGTGMARHNLRKIRYILETQPEIDSIEEIRSLYLTSHDVKLYVGFKYNTDEFTKKVSAKLANQIADLTVDEHEYESLESLVTDSVHMTLTYTTEWRERFEEEIREAFDNMESIDLELVNKKEKELEIML